MRKRLLLVMAVALAAVLGIAAPASAGGVATNVPRSTTWIAQWVSEDSGDPCGNGDWFHQTYRAEWSIYTFDGGLTVNSVKLTVWNDSTHDYLSLGGRSIVGGNGTYSIPPNYEFTYAMNGSSFTKTYTINRYFTWQGGRYVTLWVNTLIPCGGVRSTTFQLVKGF